jgi:hypothetical protein
MTPILEDSVLGSDLDARSYDILNLGALDPLPTNLAQSDDSRLTDAREPLPGSVTNVSVAPDAGIDQVKLNLSGDIPPAWLGTSSTTAAQGNLVEYLSNKGQPDGYAALDSGGKVPSAQLPATVGTGTVTSVALTMPAQFAVTGSPVTGAGILAVAWANAADLSWFGNKSGSPGPPQFYTSALPASLIPSLDASKVTTGVIPASRMPLAIGIGPTHAAGAAPSPGPGTDPSHHASDYLARDMTYQNIPTGGPAYQPTLPTPTLAHSSETSGDQFVTPSCTVDDAIFFYLITPPSATIYTEFPPEGYVALPDTKTISVYAAHCGYNNSAFVTYHNT